MAYVPASDIGQLSVAHFFGCIDACDELAHAKPKRKKTHPDKTTSQTARVDFWDHAKSEFAREWATIVRIRERETQDNPLLIKDL